MPLIQHLHIGSPVALSVSGNVFYADSNLTLQGVGGTSSQVLQGGTPPTFTGSPIITTQAASDNSTKAATTAYVTTAIANAIAGVNPAVAVQAATTAASDTSGYTYNNGVSGVGATLTGVANTALTIDGFTFTTLGQRLLVKNDTQSPSGAFNGVYYVTQVQTAILPVILTRALDYNQPSDINNTGAIPVVNGTVNGTTSWILTSTVNTVGTDPLTYVQFSLKPSTILTNTLASAHILVGNSSNVATDVAMSGDITINNTGVTAIGALKVTNAMIAAATIDLTAKVTGLLPLANGGTNANLTANNGGIFYSTASAGAILAGNATAGLALVSGASAAPTWFAPTIGSVIFAGTSGILTQANANLFWDQTNKALNINTQSSLGALMVNADTSSPNNTASYINQSSSGSAGVTIYGEQVQIQSGFTTISTSVTSGVIGLAYNNQPGTITMTGGGTLQQFGAQAVTASNNVRLGSAGTGTGNLDVRGFDASVTSGPTFNSNGTSTVTGAGVNSVITLSPTLTAVGASSTYITYGGKFVNSSTSGGNANLTSDAYGVYGVASGNLTTTGTTRHLGGYFQATGTADNNYSLYIDTPSGATTANIALYIAGGTMQHAGLGTGLGHFDSTGVLTSSLIVNADITNTTINLTTKVTGILPLANGGTNANLTASNGGIFYSSSTAGAILAGNATAGLALISGASAAPTWFAPTAGSVIFATTSGALSQDNSGIFYDATNHRLGIGTATPSNLLHVFKAAAGVAPSLSAHNGFFEVGSNTTVALQIGLDPNSPFGVWLQTARTTVDGTSYPITLNPLGGNVGIGMLNPSKLLELASDSAQKPTTNTWTITSDARVKENVSPFTDGLDILRQIKPINFTYNGLAGLPRDTGIGVIAQDIQKIAPYTISTYNRKLNPEDAEETELLGFDSHALTFILINAVQELANRVELLEKGGA